MTTDLAAGPVATTSHDDPPRPPADTWPAGLVAAALVVLFLATYLVLSAAVDWPASLDLPATEALPLVVAQAGGVALGCWLYLAFSAGLGVLALLLPRALRLPPGALTTAVVVAGVVSAVLRCVGLSRWFLATPTLAETYLAAEPGSPTRDAAAVTYTTLNDYGGGTGEILGVTLGGALFAALVAVALLRSGGPRWLAAVGAAAALALLAALVVDVFTTIGAIAFLVLLASLAVHLLRSARSTR